MDRWRTMKIGALSQATDTKVTTIRFYEEIGLIDRPARTGTGLRTYDLAAVERLNFVRNARRLGFSTDEIRSLIGLAGQPDRDCAEATAIASRHLADVEQRVRQLTALRDELAAMSANGCSARTISECRVIQAISRPIS